MNGVRAVSSLRDSGITLDEPVVRCRAHHPIKKEYVLELSRPLPKRLHFVIQTGCHEVRELSTVLGCGNTIDALASVERCCTVRSALLGPFLSVKGALGSAAPTGNLSP